jgi:hypothetical protein
MKESDKNPSGWYDPSIEVFPSQHLQERREREEELVFMVLSPFPEREKGGGECYPRWLYPPCAKGEDLSSSSCFVSSVLR